jgi:hypothetical protein
MAISRKHMRKIVVNNEIYYYKISHSCKCVFFCECMSPKLRVVIEYPDGEIKVHEFEWEKYKSFTPKDIKGLIEKENLNKC